MEGRKLAGKYWNGINRYLNLEIGGKKVATPYFTNHPGMNFIKAMKQAGLIREQRVAVMKIYNSPDSDWGRWRGKGLPEEIEAAALDTAVRDKVDLGKVEVLEIREYLLLNGLGVDCSGFVYNILTMAGVELDKLLDFADPQRRGRFKAGAFTFAGKASRAVSASELADGDLILIRNKTGRYVHVALVLQDDYGNWKIAQSTSSVIPSGVMINRMEVADNKLKFDWTPQFGTPWENLCRDGRLEMRRLNLLS